MERHSVIGMVNVPPSIAAALADLEAAEALLADARAHLADVASSAEATADEVVEIYWSVPEIAAGVLAQRLGYAGANQAFQAGAWGSVVTGVCETCGGALIARSRTAADPRIPYSQPVCEPCRDARRQQDRVALERRELDRIDRQRELRSMPYRDYLRTEHWAAVRQIALRRARWRCAVCNTAARLDVHHRTYENRGNERAHDVIALCRACHARHHGIAGPADDRTTHTTKDQ